MKVRTSATPATVGGRRETAQGSAGNATRREDGTPRLNERITYVCPICEGGGGDATYKVTRYGDEDWLIGCWSLDCKGDPRYLPKLATALGVGEGATKAHIVAALRVLGRAGRRGEPEPLPSDASVNGWQARLLGPDGLDARIYLARRGISRAEIANNRLGFDGRSITFPMWEASGMDLAGIKRRHPKDGAQMIAATGSGRAWPLYPAAATGRACALGWTLLTAGEFDALAARSAGLPASSVTLGAGYLGDRWADWSEGLRGLRVVVCFDNNEAEQARAVVRRLRAAGLDARRLDLRDLGLTTPKGDVSDYLAGDGDPARLRPRRRIRRSA